MRPIGRTNIAYRGEESENDRRAYRLSGALFEATAAAEPQLPTQPLLAALSWVLEDEVDAQLLTRGARRMELIPERRYVKLGFGGVHADSNQRLMYTSA